MIPFRNKNKQTAKIVFCVSVYAISLLFPCRSIAQLSNSYIQNQTSAYQTANFWINGYGRIGGAEGAYINYLKSFYAISNSFSGLVLESNGSINNGITGAFGPGFSFRWLAHNNGAIDYAGVTDLVMKLSGYGHLYVKDRILIGKTSQANTDYRLDVNGDIRANKIVVNTTGADYVFDSAYQLLPIEHLKEYIVSHNHLPGIPSANQMQLKGLDVGENQIQLLKKIEELTLYQIKSDETIMQLKTELEQYKKELVLLKQQIKNGQNGKR